MKFFKKLLVVPLIIPVMLIALSVSIIIWIFSNELSDEFDTLISDSIEELADWVEK